MCSGPVERCRQGEAMLDSQGSRSIDLKIATKRRWEQPVGTVVMIVVDFAGDQRQKV